MRFSLLQLDFLAGALKDNADLIIKSVKAEAEQGIELCTSPELALMGFMPCDYLQYPAFLRVAREQVERICESLANCHCALALGGIAQGENGKLYNRIFFIHKGKILAYSDKLALGEDEKPYFTPGSGPIILKYKQSEILLSHADDALNFVPHAGERPDVIMTCDSGAFAVESVGKKRDSLLQLARQCNATILYANGAGACDSVIFAGCSFWQSVDGVGNAAKFFEPEIIRNGNDAINKWPEEESVSESGLVYRALIYGIKEYCRKTGQNKIVLGLSGGIDSALVAVLACEALEAENVLGLLMPSPWSSTHSVSDALALADNLGMKTAMLPIKIIINAFDSALAKNFAGLKKDVTEENLQARIRGDLVMAFANKFGGIALATGNKSEIAVGYCTMYGDTCGALEPIGDLYKSQVYSLCEWINHERQGIIPENILLKAPSAELRPGQKDEDSLPPYDLLDPILHGLLDLRLDVSELIGKGYPADIVKKVATLVAKAQFKRLQTAPALHVHAPVSLNMPVAGRLPFDLSQG